MPDNMAIWNSVNKPPASALKTIKGGRLKGMTDVNPQWRYQAMTEQFGPCGFGWRYEITKLWNEPTTDGQVLAFATVNVFVKSTDGQWGEPIPGIGGSAMVAKESAGPRGSDECYKMAVTDALSVALKMLGVAADIYAGLWDGSKYRELPTSAHHADSATSGDRQPAVKCPKCGKTGSIIKGKQEYGGGWLCFKKKEGCGAKFNDGDERIEGDQQSPSPKRKMADALRAKGLSDEDLASIAGFLKSVDEKGVLTQETMLDVANKTDAYINEWREHMVNQAAEDIPF